MSKMTVLSFQRSECTQELATGNVPGQHVIVGQCCFEAHSAESLLNYGGTVVMFLELHRIVARVRWDPVKLSPLNRVILKGLKIAQFTEYPVFRGIRKFISVYITAYLYRANWLHSMPSHPVSFPLVNYLSNLFTAAVPWSSCCYTNHRY
jgi:hypothetical protein